MATDQELLTAYRNAALALATSQSYTFDGKTVTKAQLPQIQKMIEWLETRINIQQNPDDALGVVQIRNSPQCGWDR